MAAKFLTMREAAEELGLAYDTVRRMVRAGELPAYDVGRRMQHQIRISRAALDSFLERHRYRPMADGPTADLARQAQQRGLEIVRQASGTSAPKCTGTA